MRYYIFFLTLLLSSQISFLKAQPSGIHLSWNSDGKINTSETIAITWISPTSKDYFVKFGTGFDNLNKTERAEVKYSSDLQAYVYKVNLKKLKPNTFYFYKVGADLSQWSDVFRFKTASATGKGDKIVVGVWGDTQDNKGNYSFEQTDSIVKRMVTYPLQFTLHMGDIVENGSVIKSWKSFFDVAQPLNAKLPFMSVTGNHDVVNDAVGDSFQKPFPVYYDLFNLPNDQLNYSYNYGNTHFVALNSGFAQGAEKVDKVLFDVNSAEYKWLENDLAQARKNKKIKWIVLYCHYPIYSFGASFIPTWQSRIKPLLDKYEVDLTLSGHRHVYERHAAVRGDAIFELKNRNIYDQPKGTIYITNGSAGGSLQGVGGANLPTMIFTAKEKVYTYAIMSIEDNTINYEVFDKEGNKIDYFEIIK